MNILWEGGSGLQGLSHRSHSVVTQINLFGSFSVSQNSVRTGRRHMEPDAHGVVWSAKMSCRRTLRLHSSMHHKAIRFHDAAQYMSVYDPAL